MTDRDSGSRARVWSARVWWPAALVAVPSLLAALALLWPGPQLVDDLRARAEAALDDAGLATAVVAMDGRDAELTGVPPGAEHAAVTAVGAVTGIRVVRVAGAAAGQPPATSSPREALPGGVPAASPRPTGPPPEGRPGGLSRTDRLELTGRLGALLGSSPITFASGSAELAVAPATTVLQVAELLRAAPAALVQIEGYTADTADTPRTPETAQLLSERRVAAVADALVAGGVDRGRITTHGRGVARSPGTPAASRRVDIIVG